MVSCLWAHSHSLGGGTVRYFFQSLREIFSKTKKTNKGVGNKRGQTDLEDGLKWYSVGTSGDNPQSIINWYEGFSDQVITCMHPNN